MESPCRRNVLANALAAARGICQAILRVKRSVPHGEAGRRDERAFHLREASPLVSSFTRRSYRPSRCDSQTVGDHSPKVDDATAQGNGYGGRPILHAELGEDALDVNLNRRLAVVQSGGDLLVPHSL